MLVEGKYGQARIFAKDPDQSVIDQVKEVLDQDFVQGSKIRIMPDCHVGVGCVIGFTADLGDKVIPNIVGVDIGCGIITVELGKVDLDFAKLDKVIRSNIPSGNGVHPRPVASFDKLKDIRIYDKLTRIRRIENSLGSLGGGNHFIEVNVDDRGNKYLNIHTGSRNLGKQIASYYQKLAIDMCKGLEEHKQAKEEVISQLKAEGRDKEISRIIKRMDRDFKKKEPAYPKDLCYLEGQAREDYLHDMGLAQDYASLNRKTMARIILDKALDRPLEDFDYWETVHNYIDLDTNIIRKGAISAQAGEKVFIPFNMRDGSIIAIGKGNAEWNYSAPHGAGRLLSRKEAFQVIDLEDFKADMEGIYTSSLGPKTLDEAPAAYKPMEEIAGVIGDTVEIIDHIRPLYNFKAS